jgi:hypothetical protein
MLQEKPSALKREHAALQKKKNINCFLFLCAIFVGSRFCAVKCHAKIRGTAPTFGGRTF